MLKYDCLSNFNWQRPTICKPFTGVWETHVKIVFAVLFGAAIVGQKLHTSTFSSVQKFLDTLKMIVTLDKIIIKKIWFSQK